MSSESLMANTPHFKVSQLLDEALALNKDPAVESKLKKCIGMINSLDVYLDRIRCEPSELQTKILNDTLIEPWDEHFKNGIIPWKGSFPCLMLSGHYEGQFLRMIADITKAERILEIGMFTGYSAVTFCESEYAQEVVALDIIPFMEKFVRERTYKYPAIDNKLKVIIGPALESLKKLKAEGKQFDLVFIDADKSAYPDYYKYLMDNEVLALNGIILVDNALWYSQVYPVPTSPDGKSVYEMNEMARNDDRVTKFMLPVRDGVLMVQRKK